MAIKDAILGILLQGPAHGYRIKKIFAPFASKGVLNDGQVYPLLTLLEREGLVRKETVRQQKSPNKNLYHITDAGTRQFLDWLIGPGDEIEPIKYDFFAQYSFLVKCNFFEHLTRKQRIEKLERQIGAAREKVTEFERMREEMRARKLDSHRIRILEFGLKTQLLKIQWSSEWLEAELKTTRRKNTRVRKKVSDSRPTPGKPPEGKMRSSERNKPLTK
ncbi:MAG: helix-turn-helix transcriptional regulator [Candidatus Lindowbacteria bacterium]|nr:helix-turn-helix transcriptional regulator [Candidatus Lindowbacteria bacterium]